jgi:hypothetical protein
MAVVQISRIQVRRGQKNTGSGLPQLASGELAWAVDTQELFIGNGSVAEGSPFVGNSKILTTNDNILELFEQYQYKRTDTTVQTGADSNYPILRSVQDRLDERVSAAEFGAIGGDGTADDTLAIQRAVNQLYLNPASVGLYQGRYVLEFGPGIFTFDETIYVPSYASVVGAGQGRTVFNYTGTGSAFEFINDTSTIGSPSVIGSSTFNNQPKHILFKGFTLLLTQANTTGLKLNAVRNSVFEDIGITGIWELTDPVEANSVGVYLNAFSAAVTCKDNLFTRVSVKATSYGVYSKQDIIGNDCHSCGFGTLYTGVSFGVGANLTSVGEQYGPRNNSISDCTFEDILRQGIKVANGSGNISTSNRFVNVGNDGGGNSQAVYGHIEFDSLSNVSVHDIFDRSNELGSMTATDAYIGEVIGKTHFVNLLTRQETIVQTATFIPLCRLPVGNAIGYEITYVYKSTTHAQMRSGKINIAVDGVNGTVQLSDDFDYTGTAGAELNLQIEAVIEDANLDSTNDTIQLNYKNSTIGDNAKFTYTYRAIS